MYFVGSPRHGRSLKDTLNKDVPEQEPRRYLGRARAIVNEALIWHAAPTQKQTSALHVDNAQESLIALHESADALANPHLKSAVSSVSALWQTAKRVEQSKKEAQAWLQRSLKVLETLAEAVGQDPFNIPPVMLGDIRSFEELLLEIRNAMEPPREQGRTSRLFRLNRRGTCFNAFDKRLSGLQQKFETACSQGSGSDAHWQCVSTGAFGVPGPRDPYSHTSESNSFRSLFPLSGWKSRLDPVSSTCADVTTTTLKVLEKSAGSVPILGGAVSGISALGDTAKRVKQSKERAQALSHHSATLAEVVNHDQSNMPPLMLGRHFVNQLSEVHATTVPITERGQISRLCRLNRNEDILDASDQRLNEAQQRYMVGTVTQIRAEQKNTADSIVCPPPMTILPSH